MTDDENKWSPAEENSFGQTLSTGFALFKRHKTLQRVKHKYRSATDELINSAMHMRRNTARHFDVLYADSFGLLRHVFCFP